MIVDYGMGNLRSVEKAFHKLGYSAQISSQPNDVKKAQGLVLPGVGAFKDCIENLKKMGLIESLVEFIHSGKPFLGICLGYQILFTESEEFGPCPGLGIFKGKVKRFPEDMPDPDAEKGGVLKVPHMGWNQIWIVKEHPVLEGIPSGSYFYFVHSYYVEPEDKAIIATETEYGIKFASSIAYENIFACQFHPEKSQRRGLKLLDNFAKLVYKKIRNV